MSVIRNSTKLPKRVSGVRLPKKLRTGGGKLVDFLRNPLIAAFEVPVLIAGAVAIRNGKAVRAAVVKARDKARGTVHNLTDRAGSLMGEGG